MYVRDLDWNFHNNYYEIVAKAGMGKQDYSSLIRILKQLWECQKRVTSDFHLWRYYS